MALSFIKTSDPRLTRVSILIYGEPGAGKTSLVKTLPAASDDRILYLYADPGYAVLRERHFTMAKITTIQDTVDAHKHCLANIKNLDWVVVDGIDEIGTEIVNAMIRGTGDMRSAYGDMGKTMTAWLKAMRDLPCNVMFITHREEMQDNEKRMYYRPSFPGNMVTERLVDWFDLVGCVRFREMVADDGTITRERWLQFQTSADVRYVVKERGAGKIGEWEQPDIRAVLSKMFSKEK